MLQKVLAFIAFASTVVALLVSGGAHAQQYTQVYRFDVQAAGLVEASCRQNGKVVKSRAKIYLPANLNQPLVRGDFKLRVCATMMGALKTNFPVWIPMQAIQKALRGEDGNAQMPISHGHNSQFVPEDRADAVRVAVVSRNPLVVQVVWGRSGESKPFIGPIRFVFSTIEALSRIDGYNGSQVLPWTAIEIDVPSEGVTIRGTLVSLRED